MTNSRVVLHVDSGWTGIDAAGRLWIRPVSLNFVGVYIGLRLMADACLAIGLCLWRWAW